MRPVKWHALRHTFCSHLAMRGAPPKAIQELAGHALITVTMRYMHLTPEAHKNAIDLLNSWPVPNGTSAAQGKEKTQAT